MRVARLLFFFLGVIVLLGIDIACGGSPGSPVITVPPPSCDPLQAVEVLAATFHNGGASDLHDYAVAISFDSTVFNFAQASTNGSDLAVWDAVSKTSLAFWLESYDSQLGKALLWVKVPSLAAQASQTIWITAGPTQHCTALSSDGYSVFPFFSDVHDVANWTSDGNLAISDTVKIGPLSIQDRQVIQSDGTYNGFPGVAEAANGDWVLSYHKGTVHVDTALIILRRSQNQGRTWSDEVAYFNALSPDPTLARTPGGDLLLDLVKEDPNGILGAAYARSTDNGATWSPFIFFEQPVSNTFSFPTVLINDGPTIYGASYGPATFESGTYSPFLWSSSDDGLTWSKLAEMRKPGEPDVNETAIVQVGPTSLLAMMRTADELNTYGRYSNDMGLTWGPLISYTSQVGVLQLPQFVQVGSALVLMGRQTLTIPGVQPPNGPGCPRQLDAFVSYDGGQTFSYGTVLETYTGFPIDGGYSWPLLSPDGRVFVVYYADSHDLHKPDIKSLFLQVSIPQTNPSDAIHIASRLEPGHARHSLSSSLTRYALDFRFRSREIPAGSQFSVALQSQGSTPTTLVNWELPSTHGADPRAVSGFTVNNQFVPLMNSFTYDQAYRIRTIVDETQGLQQGMALDLFGGVLTANTPQPLAQTTSSHVATVVVGNDSNLRATDTLLDFIFLHPAADVEPQVTLTRVH